MTIGHNSAAISRFVGELHRVGPPTEAVTFAKQSLIDWFASALATCKTSTTCSPNARR